jgi:hypothetical protein
MTISQLSATYAREIAEYRGTGARRLGDRGVLGARETRAAHRNRAA